MGDGAEIVFWYLSVKTLCVVRCPGLACQNGCKCCSLRMRCGSEKRCSSTSAMSEAVHIYRTVRHKRQESACAPLVPRQVCASIQYHWCIESLSERNTAHGDLAATGRERACKPSTLGREIVAVKRRNKKMSREKADKRNLFAELMEGVEAMQKHREGKLTLRAHIVPEKRVAPSR